MYCINHCINLVMGMYICAKALIMVKVGNSRWAAKSDSPWIVT